MTKVIGVWLTILIAVLAGCSNNALTEATSEEHVSCTDEVVADWDRHLAVLTDVNDRYDQTIVARTGWTGMGVGFAYDDGVRSDRLALVVIVDPDDLYNDDLMNKIPAHFEGCEVNIQTGRVSPTGLSPPPDS